MKRLFFCRSTSYSLTSTRCRSRSKRTVRQLSTSSPRSRSIPAARTCWVAASDSSQSERTVKLRSGRSSSVKTPYKSVVTAYVPLRCSCCFKYVSYVGYGKATHSFHDVSNHYDNAI